MRDSSDSSYRDEAPMEALVCSPFLLLLTVVFAFPTTDAAAVAPPPLTCQVTRTADGYLYQLSRPFDRSMCNIAWVDHKGNVIARGSRLNQTLATSLTDQSIAMKDCWEYLHFSKDNLDCPGIWEEAHCRVNCSVLAEPLSPGTNKSCIFRSWCPDELTIGLMIGGVLLLVVISFPALRLYRSWKHKRDSAATTARFQMATDAGDERKNGPYVIVQTNSS